MISESAAELVREYLKEEKVLVVEPSATFSQTVISVLHDIGAPHESVFYAKRYEDAMQIIEKVKPKILLTEYFVGAKFGLALIDRQAEIYDDSTKLALLLTHNGSASAVAEAAEEHVDAYILKPFSMGELRERLTSVFFRKISPSEYVRRIREGKRLLKAKEFEKAAEEFSSAKYLDAKPALAHYYLGYTSYLQNKFLEAVSEFKKGLAFQPLHYKCLLGEFDSLFEQKKYKEAYQLVPTIKDNFPISPQRLGSIFISAVFSYNLQDVTTFYELFSRLDHRPPQLSRIFSAALLTAGKFFVKSNHLEKANECFAMGVSVAGPDVAYIDSVIRELLKLGAARLALGFLSKFPRDQFGLKSYSQLGFLIDQYLLPRQEVIERGRKLVAQGYADSESYRCLVRILLEEDRKTLAEDVVTKAVRDFPDLRKELYDLIEGVPSP